jgi:hypothetical protein
MLLPLWQRLWSHDHRLRGGPEMTGAPMSLAERIRKISGLGLMASVSAQLAAQAQTDALEHAHWQTHDSAVVQLLALIASPEGQEALNEVEKLAVIAADFEARMTVNHPSYAHPGDVA